MMICCVLKKYGRSQIDLNSTEAFTSLILVNISEPQISNLQNGNNNIHFSDLL